MGLLGEAEEAEVCGEGILGGLNYEIYVTAFGREKCL